MIIEFFSSNFWYGYLLYFSIFAQVLWFYYYYGLYFVKIEDVKLKKYTGKTCVIVPSFNEDLVNLKDTIESVKNADGVDHMIFINDGSSRNDPLSLFVNSLQSNEYIYYKDNRGKRDGQVAGIFYAKKLFGENYFDTYIFMDSDTVVEKDTFTKLIRQMANPKVGAVTAQILVKNKDSNWITKSIAAMYWSASNIWRQAPANYGYMQVTNGQLSCYRAKYIDKLLPQYINQKFMGRICSMSDDRWFTQHLQIDFGLQIKYEKEAIAYTYIPEKILPAYKMFLRWKRGSLRETLLVAKHIKTKPLLVIDCWWNNLVSVFQCILRIGIIILIFFFPIVILYYMTIVAVISTYYGLEMLIHEPKQIPYRILYSFLNELVFGWVIIHAIITISQQGRWATR